MFAIIATGLLEILANLAGAAGAVLAGIGVGWWLARHRWSATKSALDADRFQEALARFRALATSVAHDVEQHTSRVQELASELSIGHPGTEESNRDVIATITEMVKANSELQTQLAAAEQRLQHQAEEILQHANDARTDMLTQLNNRRAFDDELLRQHAEWNRFDTPYSLFLIDIDDFKGLNDRFGHQVGDEVLRQVSCVLRSTMREIDMVCRYGGEEFAVIVPYCQAGLAERAAERARATIEATLFRVRDMNYHLTVSVGISSVLVGDQPESLIRRVDEALYASKGGGRNQSHFHDGREIHRVSSNEHIKAVLESMECGHAAVVGGRIPASPA